MIQLTTKSFRFIRQELISDKFIKYFIAGIIAFIADTLVLYFLKSLVFEGDGDKILNLIYTSKLISGICGISISFYLNRKWSFEATGKSAKSQGFKMSIVFAINIVLASIIYSIYYDALTWQNILEFGKTQITIANAATTGTQMFFNFFIYKFIVFK